MNAHGTQLSAAVCVFCVKSLKMRNGLLMVERSETWLEMNGSIKKMFFWGAYLFLGNKGKRVSFPIFIFFEHE